MLSLIYKIGGDTQPFKRALVQLPEDAKKAGKEAGSQLGKEMGAQAKGALMSFIGAGALMSMIRGQLEMTEKIGKEQVRTGLGAKEVQVLMRASETSGLSIDQIREGGKINPAAFKALIEPIEKQGGFLTEDQILSGIAGGKDINAIKQSGQMAVASSASAAVGAFRAPFDAAKAIEGLLPNERARERFASRAPFFRDLDAIAGSQRMLTEGFTGKDQKFSMVAARDLGTAKETQEMSDKLSIMIRLMNEKL
jgi:hypothetical protein